jgi:hypothetical protein
MEGVSGSYAARQTAANDPRAAMEQAVDPSDISHADRRILRVARKVWIRSRACTRSARGASASDQLFGSR